MSQQTKKRSVFTDAQKSFWVAIAILSLLLIASVVVLAVRVGNFVYADKREVSLSSKIHDDRLDIFDLQYKNDDENITVAGMNGEKILAPGTKVEYTIRIRNTDSVAVDYALGAGLEFTSQYPLPIEVRLIAPDASYLLGDERSWAQISELASVSHSNTLAVGEAAEYVFQWQWPFEQDDEYDTFLGNLDTDAALQVSLRIDATANTQAKANGGLLRSAQGRMLAVSAVIVLLTCSIALLLISEKKRLSRRQDDADGRI